VAKLAPNVTAMIESAEAKLISLSDGLCSNACFKDTVGPLLLLVPPCFDEVVNGEQAIYSEDAECEQAIYSVLLNSTCPPLAPLEECLVALPTLLSERDACFAQLNVDTGGLLTDWPFTGICPTSCTTFTLTLMNNPCSSPIVAKLAPNVTAMIENAEAKIASLSSGLCANTCYMETVSPILALLPTCYNEILATADGRPQLPEGLDPKAVAKAAATAAAVVVIAKQLGVKAATSPPPPWSHPTMLSPPPPVA